jgi:hypothetical protein
LIQKFATQLFATASVIFGLLGVSLVVLIWMNGDAETSATTVLIKLLMISVFVILSSFAVSVAGKYLNSK